MVLLFECDIRIYQHSIQLNGQMPFQWALNGSKLTIETLEQGVVLVSLLLTFNIFNTLLCVSIANFEH